MINIILSGANGKMGRVIDRLIGEMDDVSIVCGFDVNNSLPNEYPVYPSPTDFEGRADVIIDFTHPTYLDFVVNYAVKTKTPCIVATTGLSKEQIEFLHDASSETAIFFSANMSLGINLLIDLAKKASKLLEGNFDIEIIEKHHNQKIDAPSGTAIAIADGINEVLQSSCEYVYDRHAVRQKRSKTEIGMHAVRGGTIVGEHEVIFAGCDEVIELKHTASSKEVFAVGAIKAARFMHGKGAGFYSMKDLIDEF